MKGVNQIIVNPNDEATQNFASDLARTLTDKLPVGMSIAIAMLLLQDLLIALFHVAGPMPEAVVEGVERYLDQLKANVMDHASCCLERGKLGDADESTPIVH